MGELLESDEATTEAWPGDYQSWQPPGYQFLSILGEGGFGTVFRAIQESTGQTVALKMLRLDTDSDERQRKRQSERFKRETQLCAELHHPHIVSLLDKGQTEGGQLFAAFEFVPGETLRERLVRQGPLPAPEAGELMAQVLDALVCAHTRGVVHRDLKPQNIMVSSPGARLHAKVLDFGIGAFLPDTRAGRDYQTLTLTQEVVGTSSYSAPEQLRGEPPTIKSDLYAWGLVLLECLTGEPVMTGSSLAEIYHKQLNPADIPLPPALAGHAVAAILRRNLHKDPRDRAAQAAQVYADFRQLNLTNLVGNLQPTPRDPTQRASALTGTELREGFGLGVQSERRQITVLCCNLSLNMHGDEEPDLETLEALEALQRDQLRLISDVALQYGGYVAGELGGSVMIYFGYPHVSDNDARRAARTALELIDRARRRNVLLETRQHTQIELRLGLHTGMVLTQPDEAPTGLTPNIAFQLERLAPQGTVLASATTRQLLERHIEFEPSEKVLTVNGTTSLTVFALTGERRSEAQSFLRGGQTERPLVGREPEYDAIRQLWARAKQGEGSSVLLSGEAGIGKSRLAYEVWGVVHDEGFKALDCRCLREHQNNALYPVLEMLKRHLRLQESDSEEVTRARLRTALESCTWSLETSMPILCSWLSLPLPSELPTIQHSPNRQKQILLDVLEQLILNLAGEAPFLFIVEDLHWMDPTCLDLLKRLMDLAASRELLLLCTARPEFVSPWPPEQLHAVSLQPLASEQAKAMVQQMLGDYVVEDETLLRLLERSDGIPLFIEALIHMLRDRHLLVQRHGAYTLTKQFDEASIPITLRDMLSERLERLGPARETAQMASAIGREFDYALLVQAAQMSESQVQTDLDQMISADLLYRQRHVQSDRLIFRHALIRDAAYDSMTRLMREQAHAHIADALEGHFADLAESGPAIFAKHFAGARMYFKAVDYGTKAVKLSLQRSLNDETLSHTGEVLAWIPHLVVSLQPEAELEINNMSTQALMGKYGWADAQVKASIDRSRELLGQLPYSAYTVPTLWALATYHHVAGNRAETRIVTDELAAVAEVSDDAGLKVAATTFLGIRYQTDGQFDQATSALEQALALYDPVQHRDHALTFGFDTRAWAAGMLASVYWSTGETQAALRYCEEAIAWARQINHMPSLGITLMIRAVLHQHNGDKRAVEDTTGELLDLSERYGMPAYAAYGRVLLGWATDNAEMALQVLDGLRALGCRLGFAMYDAFVADIDAQRGALEAALERLDRCLALCREYDEPRYVPELYRHRALYLLQAHPVGNAESLEALEQAVVQARQQGMLRTETQALVTLLQVFGDPVGQRISRLRDLVELRPDLAVLCSDIEM